MYSGGETWVDILPPREKLLEYFLTLRILELEWHHTYMDVASCMSLFPQFVAEQLGTKVIRQNLFYTKGVECVEFPLVGGLVAKDADNLKCSTVPITCVGSDGCAIPMKDNSVDCISLQCSFEHFEGDGDRLFVQEAFRQLKPNGKLLILPFYCGDRFQEIIRPEYATGCQFHRYYDPEVYYQRVLRQLAEPFRMEIRYHTNHKLIDPDFYCAYSLCLVKKPTFKEKLFQKLQEKLSSAMGHPSGKINDW